MARYSVTYQGGESYQVGNLTFSKGSPKLLSEDEARPFMHRQGHGFFVQQLPDSAPKPAAPAAKPAPAKPAPAKPAPAPKAAAPKPAPAAPKAPAPAAPPPAPAPKGDEAADGAAE